MSEIDKLVDQLKNRKIDRRQFLIKGAALGVSLTALGSILAACGGTATPAATETGTAAATATTAAATETATAAATETATAAATETASATATTGAAAPTGEPIKIGGEFNMTGGMSSIDVPAANGAKLAAKEINAAGGVIGRPVDLIVMDCKTDVTTASNVATQLVDVDKVVAISGVDDTNYALPIGQVCQKAKVVFITPGSTAPIIPSSIGDYAFLGCFGDNVQAAAGAEFAFKKFGDTSWLMFDKGADYTKGLSQYYKVRFGELGGKILAEDNYMTGDTDYSSQITRLKTLNPQPKFLYIASGPDEIGTIIKQVREAGITLPIMGGDGYDTPLVTQLPGPENADNVWFTTHLGLADNSPKATAFKAAYKAEYGKDLDSVFGALAYDSIYLLANAIKNANSADSTAIRDALAATKDFEGVTGKLSYPQGERIPQKAVAICKIVKGVVSYDSQIVPEKIPPA